jgi:uracil-DNA glycosylase family 4
LEKEADLLLADVKEKLQFLSLLGVGFVTRESSAPSLEETILGCQRCPLARTRTHAVPGEGDKNADLMFVGEAPGRDEDIQGRPFVGKAGQLLTKIIEAMKFQREEVYITNVVKCRPPGNRNPQEDEIASCRDFLLEQIERINPKVIVTLGRVAASFFIRSSLGMTALRGDFHDFQQIRVMPTFHPSYLIRNEGNKELKKMVWEDMKKVMAFLGKK